MPRYIALASWTDQGVGAFQETVDRADAAAEMGRSLGAEMVDIYWCIGPYDVVVVLDAPDDETATAFALKVSSGGSIRTLSMRAFTREEIGPIIEKAS